MVPGDKGVPNGLTQTYYKAFAPRFGIAWSPGDFGQDQHPGWLGMFYNPMEQLVLEQFSAEPPFGGSTFLAETFFNTPFYAQAGFVDPNPFNGILNPPRGQPVDWSIYRPILLFGEFQPHMRSQYSVQYNFGIQRELAKNLVLQVGYVGIAGTSAVGLHRLEPGDSTDLSGYRFHHQHESRERDFIRRSCDLQPVCGGQPVQRHRSDWFQFPHARLARLFPDTGQTLNFVGITPLFLAKLRGRHRRELSGGSGSGLLQYFCPGHNRELGLQLGAGQPGEAFLQRLATAGGLYLQQVARSGFKL